MLTYLDLSLYLNGYNFEHINCVDLPIAASAGYYNNDNYFYYCFYYAFYKNWGEIANGDDQIFRNQILKKFGLRMTPYKIGNTNELFYFIKESIDCENPILFLANYNSLFYYANYKQENGSHGIIINGYDTERSLILIRDSKVVDRMDNPEIDELINSDPFYKLQLTKSIFENIWIESNKIYKQHRPSLYNTLFRIEKVGQPNVLNFYDVIEEFIHNFKTGQSSLMKFIKEINMVKCNTKCNNINFNFYRRVFYHSIKVIFNFLERYYHINDSSIEIYNNYYIFKNEYLKFRSTLSLEIYRNFLKGIILDKGSIDSINKKILQMDNKLYNIIEELYLNYTHNVSVKDKKLINYALKSTVTADSGFLLPNNTVSSPGNVLNGKWANWLTDLWHSSKENDVHWLKIDLIQRPIIKKFVIRHFGRRTLNTRDFIIQGSNDNINWINLVIVNDNCKNVTTHEIEEAQYRYIRLYITNSCIEGDAARIWQFEVWGI